MITSKKLLFAFSIYITALIGSNVLGGKTMPFIKLPWVGETHLSVAIFMFPIVFIMTDIIGDLYGKKTAKLFVRGGFISVALFIIFNWIALGTPFAADSPVEQGHYNSIFYLTERFAIASLVAFIIGELQDVNVFFFVKKLLGKKKFWLRSTISNFWSQAIDSAIWFTIAFAGVIPASIILQMAIPWWLFKVGAGVLYTPLSYLGRRILRDNNVSHDDQADQNEDRQTGR